MTAEEVRKRVAAIKATKLRHSPHDRTLMEYALFVDVLRAVAHSNVARAGVRALAEAALEVIDG